MFNMTYDVHSVENRIGKGTSVTKPDLSAELGFNYLLLNPCGTTGQSILFLLGCCDLFSMVCVLMHALALFTCFVYMLQPTILLLSIFTVCLQHLIFYSVCNSLSFVVITSIKGKRSLIFTDSNFVVLFYSIALPYFNIFI